MKDMNGQTILLISDMRQVYLAEILTKKGMSVRCLDIRNSQTVEEQLLKLKKFLAGAAMLVLPIPVTKVPEQERLNEILNKNLANDTLVLGGCFTEEQRELLDRRGIRYLDFMEDEVVAQENAVATAEGAIAELTNHSPYNIEGAKILVTGYGNCGKAIAKKLRGLGARVTVLARRREVRKQAKEDGFYAVDFAFGPEEAMGAAKMCIRDRVRIQVKLRWKRPRRLLYPMPVLQVPMLLRWRENWIGMMACLFMRLNLKLEAMSTAMKLMQPQDRLSNSIRSGMIK